MEKKQNKLICIITPDYISSSPRTVKEADALWQAGFNVRVVFSQGNLENVRRFDEELIKEKSWRRDIIGWSPLRKKERPLYWKSKFRFHFFRTMPPCLWKRDRVAEYAEGRVYKELATLAASEKADLYIGHYPTGLAAAAYAVLRWKAKLGYDAEDLYTAEQPKNRGGEEKTKRIELIENRYLSRCSYVSAVSELVADEISKRYRIERPIVIHNVFPWSERGNLDGQVKDRRGAVLSLYWFSQTIGCGRGIEDAIKAAGLLKEKAQIHLRGSVSEEVKNKFIALARQSNLEKNLYFHPPVSPMELLSRAAEHDVGLALERPNSLSHKLTISNKIFFYMLAGLAIAATDTPGQKYVMSSCPNAGFEYTPGDYRTLAEHLNRLIAEPGLLLRYKQSALKAAQERWNWEKESAILIRAVSELLEKTNHD